ncbi:hypothetical protein Dimus_024248, partial [Dionaea muscipula]
MAQDPIVDPAVDIIDEAAATVDGSGDVMEEVVKVAQAAAADVVEEMIPAKGMTMMTMMKMEMMVMPLAQCLKPQHHLKYIHIKRNPIKKLRKKMNLKKKRNKKEILSRRRRKNPRMMKHLQRGKVQCTWKRK